MKKRLSAPTLAFTLLGAVAFAQEGVELRTMRTPGVLLAMAQTVDGHIWFGTSNGLYRYDGHNMLHVPLPGSTGPVRVLLASSTGGVWAATGGGYLNPPRRAWCRLNNYRTQGNRRVLKRSRWIHAQHLGPADNWRNPPTVLFGSPV